MLFITAIVTHTPAWVWALFAGLVALGLAQTRAREVSLARITTLPLLMIGLSFAGVLTAFGQHPVAFGSWAAGLVAALVLARRAVAIRGASWSPETQRLHLPGSWLPLVLFVGLFVIKYGVAVSLAMQPQLAGNAGFAALCSFTYGVFSGLFLGRALPLRALAARATMLRTA